MPPDSLDGVDSTLPRMIAKDGCLNPGDSNTTSPAVIDRSSEVVDRGRIIPTTPVSIPPECSSNQHREGVNTRRSIASLKLGHTELGSKRDLSNAPEVMSESKPEILHMQVIAVTPVAWAPKHHAESLLLSPKHRTRGIMKLGDETKNGHTIGIVDHGSE